MTIRVWYHSNCYDGFGAAWAASRHLSRGPGVAYEKCSYGFPPPAFDPGDDIYIVDFSFPRDVLLDIKTKAGKLVVLDHHKTAEEALRGLDFCTFDMERSGAGLTFDYFNGDGHRVPLIDLIEDRDLWRFKIEGTKEFHAYIRSQPFDFAVWDRIHEQLLGDSAFAIYDTGRAMLVAEDMTTKKICESSWLGNLSGHKTALVNTACHWSEVGHHLLEKWPDAEFAASFTVLPDGKIMWSLRGRGDFDVSEVAKRFGGGGHKSAAGFKTPSFVGTCTFVDAKP